MNYEDLNFIKAVHPLIVGDEAVDAVELADGRVLMIDGEMVTLFEDFEQLLEADNEDTDGKHPAIAL